MMRISLVIHVVSAFLTSWPHLKNNKKKEKERVFFLKQVTFWNILTFQPELLWSFRGFSVEMLQLSNFLLKFSGRLNKIMAQNFSREATTAIDHLHIYCLPGLETGHPVAVGQSPAYDFSVSDEQKAVFLVSVSDCSECHSSGLDHPNSSWSIARLKKYLRKKREATVELQKSRVSWTVSVYRSDRHLAYTLRVHLRCVSVALLSAILRVCIWILETQVGALLVWKSTWEKGVLCAAKKFQSTRKTKAQMRNTHRSRFQPAMPQTSSVPGHNCANGLFWHPWCGHYVKKWHHWPYKARYKDNFKSLANSPIEHCSRLKGTTNTKGRLHQPFLPCSFPAGFSVCSASSAAGCLGVVRFSLDCFLGRELFFSFSAFPCPLRDATFLASGDFSVVPAGLLTVRSSAVTAVGSCRSLKSSPGVVHEKRGQKAGVLCGIWKKVRKPNN